MTTPPGAMARLEDPETMAWVRGVAEGLSFLLRRGDGWSDAVWEVNVTTEGVVVRIAGVDPAGRVKGFTTLLQDRTTLHPQLQFLRERVRVAAGGRR